MASKFILYNLVDCTDPKNKVRVTVNRSPDCILINVYLDENPVLVHYRTFSFQPLAFDIRFQHTFVECLINGLMSNGTVVVPKYKFVYDR